MQLVKSNIMSENDILHLEAIDAIIAERLTQATDKLNKKQTKTLIWIAGIFTTLFLGISVPMGNSLLLLIAKNPPSEMYLYNNYVDKKLMHQLEDEEHTADVEAIQNPSNAANIYARHSIQEANKLDLRYRGNEK